LTDTTIVPVGRVFDSALVRGYFDRSLLLYVEVLAILMFL
jgi:hypothetical protein